MGDSTAVPQWMCMDCQVVMDAGDAVCSHPNCQKKFDVIGIALNLSRKDRAGRLNKKPAEARMGLGPVPEVPGTCNGRKVRKRHEGEEPIDILQMTRAELAADNAVRQQLGISELTPPPFMIKEKS